MSTEELAGRRAQLIRAIGVDGIAIVPAAVERVRNRDVHYPFRQDSDFQYLTGFPEPEAVAVFAPGHSEGEFMLFCRPRDREREIWDGYRQGPEGAIENYGADAAQVIGDLDSRILELLGSRKRVYYNLGPNPELDRRLIGWLGQLRAMSRRGLAAPEAVVSLDSVLHEMRLRKSPVEIELMRHAAQVSAAAHVRAMQTCRPGRFEFELAAEIHNDFERHGMVPAYGSIVGGGANGCVLHYTENRDELRDGTLCLIDAGGEHQGYCADITRTFPVGGRFSGEQRAVYDLVLSAQEAAIAELQVGKPWDAPHRTAVRVLTQGLKDLGVLQGDVDALIEDEKYTAFYMHQTGHWLGMDVHDVGAYKLEGQWRRFEAGMVLTVEPGLYFSAQTPGVPARFADMGIRIEDDVAVTAAMPDVLTRDVPKQAAEIEALMAA